MSRDPVLMHPRDYAALAQASATTGNTVGPDVYPSRFGNRRARRAFAALARRRERRVKP